MCESVLMIYLKEPAQRADLKSRLVCVVAGNITDKWTMTWLLAFYFRFQHERHHGGTGEGTG